jgi:hypothetical protein
MTEARLVSAEVSRGADLRARGNQFRGVAVRGVTEDYTLLNEMPLQRAGTSPGRTCSARKQVVVLGYEVAQNLFPRRADPVGQEVKLGGRHFKVVGVVEDRGTIMGNNRNQFAVVPISTWQKVFGSGQSVDHQGGGPGPVAHGGGQGRGHLSHASPPSAAAPGAGRLRHHDRRPAAEHLGRHQQGHLRRAGASGRASAWWLAASC